jgi:hypothetical protein
VVIGRAWPGDGGAAARAKSPVHQPSGLKAAASAESSAK